MANFGMVGKLTTKPQDRDQLIDILSQAAKLMDDIEECYLYVVSTDAEDDGKVWVMELWESKEAHDQSLTLPEVRELIGQAMPILTEMPSGGVTLIPMSGKGLK